MIGILSQNSWKMNLNETQIGRLSVWTREIITYTYIYYILTCIIMYLLLLSPEIHQQMILAPSRPGSIHCSIDLVLNTTVRNFCKDKLLKMMTGFMGPRSCSC